MFSSGGEAHTDNRPKLLRVIVAPSLEDINLLHIGLVRNHRFQPDGCQS